MKTCPYCAEQIQDLASVCRYCRKDLPPLPGAPKKPTPSWLVAICIITPLCGAVALAAWGSYRDTPEVAICRAIVEEQTKLGEPGDLKCSARRTGPASFDALLTGKALGLIPFSSTCRVTNYDHDKGSFRWACK